MLHPVYNDEGQVRQLTLEHLAEGRTVLQMFQLADSEENHALRVLDLIGLADNARVLSLGCGVGGMEAYWHDRREGLRFELVNLSQAQLDLCICPGAKVCADATHYRSTGPGFDLTVLAYVLGHVEAETTLRAAVHNTRKGGRVVVLDVFDGTEVFDSHFSYSTVASIDMRAAGFVEVETPHAWRLMPLIHRLSPWVTRHATPAMWVRDV